MTKTNTAPLPKKNTSRESEGKRTTSIRPDSLSRAQAVLPFLGGSTKENTTDFISNAVDQRVRAEIKKNPAIRLPDYCAFA